jgi:hypothetical protein
VGRRPVQADHVLRRLDIHAHLVVVVGTRDRDAVHPGTDHRPQNLPSHGDATIAVLGVAGSGRVGGSLGHRTIMHDVPRSPHRQYRQHLQTRILARSL